MAPFLPVQGGILVMMGLDRFSGADLWSPGALIVFIIIGACYLLLVGPLRGRFVNSEPVSIGRRLLFLAGLVTYYIGNYGPFMLLGHLMFSMHMLSMVLSFFLAPPLLLLGLPKWLVQPVISHRAVAPFFRFLTHPLVTVLCFNVFFSFYHMPVIHDYVMTHYAVHMVYFNVLLLTSFMMWWPVLGPMPETEKLSELRKMAYIFSNGVLITPACALIIFAENPLYSTFNDPQMWAMALGYCIPAGSDFILSNFVGPESFALFPPAEDQQLGGVIMKVMQEIIYGSALAYVFFNWYRKEKHDDELGEQGDPLPN
ncbi:cytochrome c oxidase assembly factor CtaG [Paenibacillus sp. y28]|uniref:cytochrome c oxidase assembly factor CtaG n=1 Tax=Paenibacillus sp. y28 TaxID=3129110 RepID=UPI00301B1567